jgi:hypothetical protein
MLVSSLISLSASFYPGVGKLKGSLSESDLRLRKLILMARTRRAKSCPRFKGITRRKAWLSKMHILRKIIFASCLKSQDMKSSI